MGGMTDALPDLPDPRLQFLIRLIPKFGEPPAQYRRDAWERELRRVEAMGKAAEQRVPIEELFDAIRTDERVEGMFRTAVESAQRATSDDKVRLLGHALASGALAADDAQVDEAAVLLRLASDLDGPELRALAVLVGHSADYGHRLTDPYRVLVERGFSRVVLDPVIGRLVQLGLLSVESEGQLNDSSDKSNDFVDVLQRWVVTEAALAMIELLKHS